MLNKIFAKSTIKRRIWNRSAKAQACGLLRSYYIGCVGWSGIVRLRVLKTNCFMTCPETLSPCDFNSLINFLCLLGKSAFANLAFSHTSATSLFALRMTWNLCSEGNLLDLYSKISCCILYKKKLCYELTVSTHRKSNVNRIIEKRQISLLLQDIFLALSQKKKNQTKYTTEKHGIEILNLSKRNFLGGFVVSETICRIAKWSNFA